MSRPFEAQYAGECTDCEDRFPAGTLITLTVHGARHAQCPDTTPRPARAVCPRCFTEKKSVIGSCACEEI